MGNHFCTLQLLPLIAAQLQLTFQQKSAIDFIELGLAASHALGEEEQPTDLALSLDYRIRHLLVDEFRDTSVMQFKFLEKLIAGWQPGDGRSIFLVGDPMQSIYRFRNAEVGLFLRATHQGIGQIQLIPLHINQQFSFSNECSQMVKRSISANFGPCSRLYYRSDSLYPS